MTACAPGPAGHGPLRLHTRSRRGRSPADCRLRASPRSRHHYRYVHGADHALDIGGGELRRKRQVDRLPPDPRGMRVLFAPPAVGLLVKRMLGDAEVMHANADLPGGHPFEEKVATD